MDSGFNLHPVRGSEPLAPSSRRAFVIALGFGLIARVANAQVAAKTYRVGVLDAGGCGPPPPAFLAALRELGWVEGRNLAFENRCAEGKLQSLPALAADLAALRVDAIIAVGTPCALAARNATATIPIVLFTGADPVQAGVVSDLARPGGNVTGVSRPRRELADKCLEILREALPKVRRVALLTEPASAADPALREAQDKKARGLGIRLSRIAMDPAIPMEAAFSEISRARAEAIMVFEGTEFDADRLVALALQRRLPVIADAAHFVAAGGLLSYGPARTELERQTAMLLDQILRGAKPADLPVRQPTRFELWINMRTAKALAASIPNSILVRADQVIE